MLYILIFIGFVAVCFVFGQMVKNKPVNLPVNMSPKYKQQLKTEEQDQVSVTGEYHW